MTNQPEDVLEFYKSALQRSLIYKKYLILLGYPIDREEIRKLELLVYPELNDPSNIGDNTLGLRELDELRLFLFTADLQNNGNDSSTKAAIIRLENTILRMRPDNNHQRPHFHLEYKTEFSASYAIDTLERFEGNMPDRYEKKTLEWASSRQAVLNKIWNRMKSGKDITELLLEARQSG
jgi:hypothetical protein